MNDDAQDSPAPAEPVVTGQVQVALSGNRAAALGHVRQARRLLGSLRAVYGINERIAAGEPGGFFQRSVQMDDGTRIIIASNDGHDTVRIHAPLPVQPPAPVAAAPVAAAPPPPSLVGPHRFVDVGHVPQQRPQPESEPPPSEEESEGLETDDYVPYLWIGVRLVNSPEAYRVHACLWEPPADGGEPRILSNRNAFLYWGYVFTTEEYPLGPWLQFVPDDPDEGVAYTDQHLVMLLPHNGYPMRAPDYGPASTDDAEWDVIFVSDPENDLQLVDLDGAAMTGTGFGDYYLKLMLYGADCPETPPQIDAEIRIITGKRTHQLDASHRVTLRDASACLMGVMPFGMYWDGVRTRRYPCFGSNPHGPHWWQGMALVQLAAPQVGVAPEQLMQSLTHFTTDGGPGLPPTGFEPAAWPDMCSLPPGPTHRTETNVTHECYFDLHHFTEVLDDTYIYSHLWSTKTVTTTTYTFTYTRLWDDEAGAYGEETGPGVRRDSVDVSAPIMVFDGDVTWNGFTGGVLGFDPAFLELEAQWVASVTDAPCP